jgi:tetratricopeptide (TPR) repeat protein
MRMLDQNPLLAAEQARQILLANPGQGVARLLLGMAHNALGESTRACEVLRSLADEQPEAPRVQMELGIALADVGEAGEAINAFEAAVRLQPTLPRAWLHLASLLDAAGKRDHAARAYLMHARTSMHDPQLMAAGEALSGGNLPDAEQRLRERLRQFPNDVAAMRMLAELAVRVGRNEQGLALLEHCLALAPGFAMARQHYALVLDRSNRHAEALAEVETLLAVDPDNPALRNLQAAILGKLGEYGDAIRLYEALLEERPKDPGLWVSLGHALKIEGRTPRAIHAYRRAIELDPGFGSAWWSLANLKTLRFDAADIGSMRAQLARRDLDDAQLLHVRFALGKALEDVGEYRDSFEHYAEGNRIRRAQLPHDADSAGTYHRQTRQLHTRAFFEARAGSGCDAPAPIFVVGMPRAGSTLVEQILSSHPLVEGTMELPTILGIARELRLRHGIPEAGSYHQVLAELGSDELRELGERYLQQTRAQRKLGRPYFIDKMPNNFAHVGLIHLILPNAKIVDVRRHPLACGFSVFKQNFTRGQAFSNDLRDIGHFYVDYVELLAHYDAVLPGRVHRLIYEELVADTEAQVHALLDHCGLAFDERCLRFFENDRAVRTASSEQVRQPIYTEGLDHWRHYEQWLYPLKLALGPVLDRYPEAPRS